MGDWGAAVSDSDEAADWFHRFWRDGWIVIEQEIETFDPAEERFDSIRAAAHVLACFGTPYMAPVRLLDKLPAWLARAEQILRFMIDPPGPEWAFLQICEDDPAVLSDIKDQIEALHARRSSFAVT